jgi:hypothetical protein
MAVRPRPLANAVLKTADLRTSQAPQSFSGDGLTGIANIERDKSLI